MAAEIKCHLETQEKQPEGEYFVCTFTRDRNDLFYKTFGSIDFLFPHYEVVIDKEDFLWCYMICKVLKKPLWHKLRKVTAKDRESIKEKEPPRSWEEFRKREAEAINSALREEFIFAA